MSTHPQPPQIARWLLRLQPLGDRRAEIESDLLELFHSRATERGDGMRRGGTTRTSRASGGGPAPRST